MQRKGNDGDEAKVKKLNAASGSHFKCSVSAVALTSATYAWYVANNSVISETSFIMVEANGFMLQM